VGLSLTLTIDEQITFNAMIQGVQNEILSNKCKCLTDDDKVSKAGLKMKKSLSKRKSLKKKVHYKKVGPQGVAWGYWRDLVSVGISIQGERDILTLDVNDNNPLFTALRNNTACNATVSADIETLIIQIKVVLKKPWTKTQKHAKIHKIMKAFFLIHIDIEEKINLIEVGSLGSVENFRRVFKVAHQTTRLAKIISGKDDATCELLRKLTAVVTNTSINITIRTQFSNLHDSIQGMFDVTVDLQLRLQFVSQECHSFLAQSPWAVDILMDIELVDPDSDCGCDNGIWGDVYELIFCSHFCTNEGSCGEVNEGEGTDAPTSSTAAVTSSSGGPTSSSGGPTSSSGGPTSSSAKPSTSSAAPSSTSVPPVNCANRPALIVVNGCSYGNQSILEYSIQVVYDSWTGPTWGWLKTMYSNTFNNIKATIAGGLGTSAKINKIRDYMTNFSKNNLATQDYEMEIVMKEGNFNGKIRDFCNCGYA